MTRLKADKEPLIAIFDWRQADQLIREVGEIQMKITSAEHAAADDIAETKLELEGKTKQWQERSAYIVKSLELFADNHTKDFGDARSRKLDFGIIGWRFSAAIEIAATTLEYIKSKLSIGKQKACIRVKETVDKEALAKLTDEELASVKARRKNKDAFFVEPILPKAVDYIS